ncbi:MAG TPA: tetratricopeptide repeat protein [Methylomirabilota bacterium]
MSTLQITLIVVIALPALAIVVWPLLGRRARVAAAPERAPDDRRLELEEEKAALYRALRELEFDHDAGHLSDPDYLSLRERYESRAAALITELDLLPGGPEMAPALSRPRTTVSGAERVSGTRHPATLAAGAVALLIFGVIIGVNAGRFTERDESVMPGPAPSPVGPPAARLEPGKPIPPEVLAGMLSAARQSLFEGRYSEAIAAYQAVLKRDERNVDAMTHLGLIVAVGGHADSALATFDRALKIDPKYAPAYLYRGQVLYEQKQDYVGAVAAWERFMALAPNGEDRDRVAELVKQARGKQQAR